MKIRLYDFVILLLSWSSFPGQIFLLILANIASSCDRPGAKNFTKLITIDPCNNSLGYKYYYYHFTDEKTKAMQFNLNVQS